MKHDLILGSYGQRFLFISFLLIVAWWELSLVPSHVTVHAHVSMLERFRKAEKKFEAYLNINT